MVPFAATGLAGWRRMSPSRRPSMRWRHAGSWKPIRAIAEAMQAKGFKISHEGVKGVLAAHSASA
jgi:hypothetical protein